MKEIIFLGTAGARYVVFRQIRASGGIWFRTENTNILVDPGPCSLLRITRSKHGISTDKLDAVILSHRHLDHSADINVIIEAMTEGGFKKRGKLFAPYDAVEGDSPVVLQYLKDFLEEIIIIEEKKKYSIKDITFYSPCRHHHRGETYGFIFEMSSTRVGYLSDTEFFPELKECYKGCDVLILNVVRLKKKDGLDHLSVPEAEEIIEAIKPKKAVITHFGMTLIKAKPWVVAEEMKKRTGIEIISANDGMKLDISSL